MSIWATWGWSRLRSLAEGEPTNYNKCTLDQAFFVMESIGWGSKSVHAGQVQIDQKLNRWGGKLISLASGHVHAQKIKYSRFERDFLELKQAVRVTRNLTGDAES